MSQLPTNDAWRRNFKWYWLGLQRKKAFGELTLRDATSYVMGREAAEVFYRFEHIREKTGPLAAHETVALTFAYPKVGAILYDRVWAGATVWDADIPAELLAVTGGDVMCLGMTFRTAQDHHPIAPSHEQILQEIARDPAGTEEQLRDAQAETVKATGARARLLYGDESAFRRRFLPGSKDVLVVAIQNAPFIDEARLSWDQVLEVRKDARAQADLRRFLKFADDTFCGLSVTEIIDRIAALHESYVAAVKKHGLNAKIAWLETVYDLRTKLFAAGTATVLAKNDVLDVQAALAATLAFSVGESAIKIARAKYDLDQQWEAVREQHGDIAFLANLARDE